MSYLQYLMGRQPVETATALPRVVDCHSLPHMNGSKAAKACRAADAVDGIVTLGKPTIKLAAAAYGVSVSYVTAARRLSPEEREAVKRDERPLVLPRNSVAAAAPPVDPQQRLHAFIAEIGIDAVLNLLVEHEGPENFAFWYLDADLRQDAA